MAKILLVEDIDDARWALGSLLVEEGHQVTEAVNNSFAIKNLHQDNFDLVITDILMPEQSGTEILTFMEQMANRPSVLAMTEKNIHSSNQAALFARHKADAILVKPFEKSDFKTIVFDLLEGHSRAV